MPGYRCCCHLLPAPPQSGTPGSPSPGCPGVSSGLQPPPDHSDWDSESGPLLAPPPDLPDCGFCYLFAPDQGSAGWTDTSSYWRNRKQTVEGWKSRGKRGELWDKETIRCLIKGVVILLLHSSLQSLQDQSDSMQRDVCLQLPPTLITAPHHTGLKRIHPSPPQSYQTVLSCCFRSIHHFSTGYTVWAGGGPVESLHSSNRRQEIKRIGRTGFDCYGGQTEALWYSVQHRSQHIHWRHEVIRTFPFLSL